MEREAVEEFRKIYKKVFGEDLKKEEAVEKAKKFLNLLKTIYYSNEKKERENN